MPFHLLVDYDNLSDQDKSRELLILINKLVYKLSPAEINDKNVQVRLYGGWYENNNVTKKAQNLRVEIMRNFPQIITLSDNKSAAIVNVELALSLLAKPTTDLFNTYRRRGVPAGLGCEHPNTCGCTDLECPIVHVFEFITKSLCSKCKNVRPENVIYKPEQKLVDTMLTTDLIDVATTNKRASVVSSDDDLWPGILFSISRGAVIYHLLTKTTALPTHYARTVKTNYYTKSLL